MNRRMEFRETRGPGVRPSAARAVAGIAAIVAVVVGVATFAIAPAAAGFLLVGAFGLAAWVAGSDSRRPGDWS